jgi:hypothetical protein
MTQRQRSSTLLVVGLFILLGSGMAVAWATPSSIQRRRHGSSYTRLYNFLDQFHGESDSAYFKRVTAAASDPVTFERMVLNQQHEYETPSSAAAAEHHVNGKPTTGSSINGDTNNTTDAPKPKKGYVRAEVWEAEEQRRRKNGELTWEERVQFEGQRHGNRVSQNDILRHHLNAFK